MFNPANSNKFKPKHQIHARPKYHITYFQKQNPPHAEQNPHVHQGRITSNNVILRPNCVTFVQTLILKISSDKLQFQVINSPRNNQDNSKLIGSE